jgi:hypothetical protein
LRVAVAKFDRWDYKRAERGCGVACEPTAIGVGKRGRFATHVQLVWLIMRPPVPLNCRDSQKEDSESGVASKPSFTWLIWPAPLVVFGVSSWQYTFGSSESRKKIVCPSANVVTQPPG